MKREEGKTMKRLVALLLAFALAMSLMLAGCGSPSVVPEGLKVGDTFTLGNYGGQDIAWQVLAIEDGKALVITRDIIDLRAYNDEDTDVTWETCTLRSWLNDDFLNTAFTNDQRNAIALTSLKNNDNPDYGTDGGADTKDYVFLLSIDEVGKYFGSDAARIADLNMSDGLIDDAAHRIDENPYYYGDFYTFSEARELILGWNNSAGWWWLRSPGYISAYAANVDTDGSVHVGDGLAPYPYGVCPALWLNL